MVIGDPLNCLQDPLIGHCLQLKRFCDFLEETVGFEELNGVRQTRVMVYVLKSVNFGEGRVRAQLLALPLASHKQVGILKPFIKWEGHFQLGFLRVK